MAMWQSSRDHMAENLKKLKSVTLSGLIRYAGIYLSFSNLWDSTMVVSVVVVEMAVVGVTVVWQSTENLSKAVCDWRRRVRRRRRSCGRWRDGHLDLTWG
eukprot:Selendium_serpulae@DN5590_c1_g1_i1.p1